MARFRLASLSLLVSLCSLIGSTIVLAGLCNFNLTNGNVCNLAYGTSCPVCSLGAIDCSQSTGTVYSDNPAKLYTQVLNGQGAYSLNGNTQVLCSTQYACVNDTIYRTPCVIYGPPINLEFCTGDNPQVNCVGCKNAATGTPAYTTNYTADQTGCTGGG